MNTDDAFQCAMQRQRAGDVQQAEQILAEILRANPQHSAAANALFSLFYDGGRFAEAAMLMQKCLAFNPFNSEYLGKLALAQEAQSKSGREQVTQQPPTNTEVQRADALYQQGLRLQEQGHYGHAAQCYREAIDVLPGFVAAFNNLGNTLQLLGRLDEAIECYQRGIAWNPNMPELHSNLGSALYKQGQIDAAVNHCRKAVALAPLSADAHNNLGAALHDTGEFSEAMACRRRALEIDPTLPEAHIFLATQLLREGNFAEGWREYEWRWKATTLRGSLPSHPEPHWEGQPLPGKTLLVQTEQGLGDTLQFIRYVSILKSQEARLLLSCPGSLAPLLRESIQVDGYIPEGAPLPKFDYCVSLLSVPRILRTDLSSIPRSTPYLAASPQLIRQWRERLATFPQLRVGINWRGKEVDFYYRSRSIPLPLLAQLGEICNVQLFSLQKLEPESRERRLLEFFHIHDFGDALDASSGAFMDTAAIMKNLDLVITSDTSIAHLAGALGVPVWVGLSFVADWRWLSDRDDSPWYPTMRLFRQIQRGDWTGPVEKMKEALKMLATTRPPQENV